MPRPSTLRASQSTSRALFNRRPSRRRPFSTAPSAVNTRLEPPTMPAPLNAPQRIKRLVVLSDGTWNNLEMDCPTNISVLARAIEYEDADQIQQVVHYDSGVGTEVSTTRSLVGGLTGDGIDLNIRQLYTFLALNYHPGDEIYMFGFSRGAYTVRSVAGLINHSGLVHRDHIDYVHEAYDLYRTNKDPDNAVACNFRRQFGDRAPIKLLAVFDTVGALGLPWSVPWPLPDPNAKYRFHDTSISALIEHAVHILSIDEDRKAYSPTLMKASPNRDPSQVTEVWFPGVHSGVGGGLEEEKQLSANTLCFLVDEMKRRGIQLQIDESRLPKGNNFNVVPRGAAYEKGINSVSVQKFFTGCRARDIPSLDQCHHVTVQRYHTITSWRPLALEKFRDQLMKLDPSKASR